MDFCASPRAIPGGGPFPALPPPFAPGAGGSPLFARPRGPGRAPPRQLTEDEAGQLAYAFDRLAAGQADAATGEPLVTPRQLKLALRALGFAVRKPDVRGLLRDAGLDADAPLGRATFLEAAGAKLRERAPAEASARAFALFDAAGVGTVGAAELRAVARQLGVDITPAEAGDMVAEFAGGGGDGRVGPAEFAAIIAEAGGG